MTSSIDRAALQGQQPTVSKEPEEEESGKIVLGFAGRRNVKLKVPNGKADDESFDVLLNLLKQQTAASNGQ